MKTLGVIPARYASTRLPGKPLLEIEGKSIIQRVYEQACKASLLTKVIVATDDQRILEHVQQFGGEVEMTSPDHKSGTDRCAEVAQRHPAFDFVVNVQGDEPFINPEQIDVTVQPLHEGKAQIGTLAKPLKTLEEVLNPNVVKVVLANNGRAMYFSRSSIPFVRNTPQEDWIHEHTFFKHIGLYAFQRNTLLELANLPAGELESAESLEQLRWLAAGYSIFVNKTEQESIGIDTPEDLEMAKQKLKKHAE